ncbi:MAG: cation diffusion facilitator family transporter [Desulfomonilaceae bacterium]
MIDGLKTSETGLSESVKLRQPGGLEAGKKILCLALFSSALLMGAKFFAYYLTQSSAILSDALESIINVVAAAFALGSVIVSARPPDESHPYGHGKIEYFSAGFEGALIILAAISIFYEGVIKVLRPHELPQLDVGIILLLCVTVLNALLGYFLIRVGLKTRSDAVFAHGKHIITDVYSSVGVAIGLIGVMLTQYWFIDGLIACLVGANILVSGLFLVKRALSGLMDASDPLLLEDICDALSEHRKGLWIDMHQLRAWRSGQKIFIDFHLILPRNMSLERAHMEVKELEEIFSKYLGKGTEVLVHLDPCEDPECPACSNDPCEMRSHPHNLNNLWRRHSVS